MSNSGSDAGLDLREVLQTLRKQWLLVTALTVLGVLGGAALSMVMSPKYESTTQLYVSVPTDATTVTSDLVQGTAFARDAVISYVDVVPSALVLDQVIAQLGLDTTSTDLAEQVSASSPEDTVLLNITVTAEDPAAAAEIANTIGAVFIDVVVNDLEQPVTGGVSSVQVKTIQPAIEPESAVSPNVPLNLVVGFLLGLALGVGIAVLRKSLDNRIHTFDDARAVTDAPLLGGVWKYQHSATRPLVVHTDPRSPRSESFRGIRTNLQFLNYNGGSNLFVISSAGPAEGKTTTTANLAISLAETGATVALVDGDLRRPTIANIMGLEGAVGLTDVLIGQAKLDDVLQQWGAGELSVLPAGRIPPNPSELLGSDEMAEVTRTLGERFDYVLIDSPPLLAVPDAAVISRHVTGTILVAAAGSTTKPELASAIASLEAIESRPQGLILTKVPVNGADRYGYGSYGYSYRYTQEPAPEESTLAG